jgi:hypothetical protein
MSKAIDFYNNTIQYRFIDLDLSVTFTLDNEDFLFVPGFKSSDAKSHLNVPRDLFSKLFYYNIHYADVVKADYTKMRYAMDSVGWYKASYSNAIVDVSNQVVSSSVFQNIKYDYIRFILKAITGNNTTSGLFRNTDKLLQNIVAMDPAFNNQIVSILDTCGTKDSPKGKDTYYNNPSRVLIESLLANDNVIETDNVIRRSALIDEMTTYATDFHNNSTQYYVLGTKTGEVIQYCYFPIYWKSAVGRTEITFQEYDTTFYQNTSIANRYENIDSIFTTAYQLRLSTLYYYPLYLSNIDGTKTSILLDGIVYYTTDPYGKPNMSATHTMYSTVVSNNIAYYVKGTKEGETKPQMYFPIYLNNAAGRIPVTFTDASYASYTLYTTYTNYSNINTTIVETIDSYSIYASYLNSPPQYYDISLNASVDSTKIQFTDISYRGMTFYTNHSKYDTTYYVYDITTGNYYYPIYLTNDTGRAPIQFTNVDPLITFYTTDPLSKTGISSSLSYIDYTTLNTSTSLYYIYGTKTGTNYQQYYTVYTNRITSLGSLNEIQFKEYPGRTFYYKNSLNDYDEYNSNIYTNYYVYGTNNGKTGYYYPLSTFSSAIATTPITITTPLTSITFYSTENPVLFSLRYEDIASTLYNNIKTIPYYVYGTKTGTDTPYNYFPIYVNYPGHVCSTPITFKEYPNNIFYTNYDEISPFYPFHFEYSDSLSVRITYKPKYNTYLGKEVRDYSYEVSLDMGLESIFNVPYKTLGDENTTGVDVGEITYSGTKVYRALSKAFHYVIQNANMPNLYDSPYHFYPTLNDIYNISFDTLNTTLGTKWYVSIFCRPRAFSSDVYDQIGFDRFNSENTVSIVDTWTTYDINSLTWTNGTTTGLTWENVLNLIITPTTTPYGYIKTNGQQQIMVIAISSDNAGPSIRNVKVIFKDDRIIQMT